MSTIDLEDAPDWFARVSRDVQAAALTGLYLAGLRGAQRIVTHIIPSRSPAPVDRGVYRAGWGPSSVTRQGAAVFLQNREAVAPFIEFGVRPENVKIGRRMIAALSEWALRKGMTDDPKEATSIAWAIAKKAQREGFFNRDGKKGLGILKELVESQEFRQIIADEIGRAIANAVR